MELPSSSSSTTGNKIPSTLSLMLMEGNGASQHSTIEEASTEDNEKPPPWDTMDDDQVYSNEIRELLGEDTVISREDIENSLKKYEELSRQLDETKRSLEQYEGNDEEEDRRNSLGASTDGEGEHLLHMDHDDNLHHIDHDTHLLHIEHLHHIDHDNDNPLHHSDHEILHTYPVSGNASEEERSKSDDDKDELREKQEQEEERSKSDGDKDELLEEDDEDAVPLRIQAALKSSKLTLSNCWLKTIPSEVWDLTHLTELDLSANYLKKGIIIL